MSTQITISPEIKLVVNTTPITGGSAGQILFQTTGNTVGESSNLVWDNAKNIAGIGTNAPFSGATNVISSLQLGASASNLNVGGFCSLGKITVNGYGAVGSNYYLDSNNFLRRTNSDSVSILDFSAAGFYFRNASSGGANTTIALNELASIRANGNVLINTTTDAGFRLDVNGTARTQQLHTFLQGTYLDANTSNNYHRVYTGASTYGGLQLQNEIVNYTGYITTGRSGNQLGINFFHTTYAGGVSASSHQKFTQGGVQFGSLSLPNTLTVFNVGGGNGTVNYPIIANNQLNTTNTGVGYLFQTGDITGSGPINHAAISAWKTNGAAPSITSSLRFYTISDASNTLSEKMRIADSGNFLINTTTDAGFKLDVNGTARVSGDLSVPTGKITFQTSAFGIDCNTTTGVFDIKNSTGSLQTTRISFSQGTYLNIYQPTQSSTGITSGIINTISTPITYAWSSGTVQSNLFVLNPTINNTGTYNGTFRGFYYNPTLTSMTGTAHFAFHSTSGRIRFENLPTSPAGLSSGDVWNNLGILTIV